MRRTKRRAVMGDGSGLRSANRSALMTHSPRRTPLIGRLSGINAALAHGARGLAAAHVRQFKLGSAGALQTAGPDRGSGLCGGWIDQRYLAQEEVQSLTMTSSGVLVKQHQAEFHVNQQRSEQRYDFFKKNPLRDSAGDGRSLKFEVDLCRTGIGEEKWKRIQALWDTGSQICAIDEVWKESNIPDVKLRDVAELFDPLDPLQIEAANGTEMPYVGWLEVSFKLTANDEELIIPMLVLKGSRQPCPIIGFNVIEYLVVNRVQDQTTDRDREKLMKTVKIAFPHLKRKNRANAFINAVSVGQPCEHNVRTANERVDVPKYSSIQIECRVQAPPFKEDKTLIFEPHENPQWPEGLEFCDTLVSGKAGMTPKIVVSVQNPTSHDITLPARTVIGMVQSVRAVYPASIFKSDNLPTTSVYEVQARSPGEDTPTVDMLFNLTSEQGDSNHHNYMEKWKQGMEEAYEITRENAHKAATRSKRHYDSKVKSSVLHPVVRQVSKDIPVYELRPEKGKGRSRILHRNLLLPCDHLPLETQVRPRAKKRTVETTEEMEQADDEVDDDDEYYSVPLQQQLQPCQPQALSPVSTDEPAEHIQSEENMSHEPQSEHGVINQLGHLPEQEDSHIEDQPAEETVPSLVSSEHSRTSEQEYQRPRRQHRRPKVFTYDRLGSPVCYNMRTLPHHKHLKVPWTHAIQPFYYQQPYGHGW
ncbi:hypothetical protein L3Q82_021061 [Scortum barcoo]|uniref:Uncharacterized protein n=1 Tax=Scortum barcoo TaxID=214431 RepID=A0ACB8X3M2_9TELE|nr:hypothetical protein L3Q82_021061 [Scortum barcoo]